MFLSLGLQVMILIIILKNWGSKWLLFSVDFLVFGTNKLFINFIRNYAADLDKAKNKFMLNANIDINSIYDLNLGNDNSIILLTKEFKYNDFYYYYYIF